MLVAALALTYGIGFSHLAKFCVKKCGISNCGGAPRWCNAVHLLPQVLALPAVLMVAKFCPSVSITCERLFFYIFGHLMVFDFLKLDLNGVMIAHHSVTLFGHTFALMLSPPLAFSKYWAGATALEMGSGACCMWWNWGDQHKVLDQVYGIGMTLSNIYAGSQLLRWAQYCTSLAMPARVFPVLVTSYLIYGRQKECMRVLRDGRGAATTG